MPATPANPVTTPDDFNSAFLKGVIPELYTEMYTNSALGSIFDAFYPTGVDTTKFGKIIRINHNPRTFKNAAQMLSRIPVMIGRNYKDNNLILKVRVIREVVDYTAYDNYLLAIHLTDLNIKNCYSVKKYAEKACLFTPFTKYDSAQGDFRGFLLSQVQHFNNQTQVTNFVDERKKVYEAFKLAGSRF